MSQFYHKYQDNLIYSDLFLTKSLDDKYIGCLFKLDYIFLNLKFMLMKTLRYYL